MGRGHSCVCSVCGDDSACLLRQQDAAADVGHFRSDGGADGRRGGRSMAGISDECLVCLSALVPAGTDSIHLLVPVSSTGHVEKDAMARKCVDVRGQHPGGRDRTADASQEKSSTLKNPNRYAINDC